jgi:hypothetical protein
VVYLCAVFLGKTTTSTPSSQHDGQDDEGEGTQAAIASLVGGLVPALGASLGAAGSVAAGSWLSQVESVYRSVRTAEYFGPASRVCSRLTATGLAAFAAGGGGPCPHAFALSNTSSATWSRGLTTPA